MGDKAITALRLQLGYLVYNLHLVLEHEVYVNFGDTLAVAGQLSRAFCVNN